MTVTKHLFRITTTLPSTNAIPGMSASKLRSRLSEIEQHMALIEAQMAVLRVERETVARELKAIVYPVLTVPAEILSEIFLQHVSHSGQRLGPLLLTWICRRWREVAVCTPRLWTSFYLESVPLAALWYSRAGTLPLDLNFLTSEPLELSELLPVIIAYSAQWEKLTLDPILLPANLFFSFPCLAKLELLDSTSDGVVTMPTLTDSPRLRELYIDISGLNGLPATFPWAQLTELTIISNLHTCLELLAQTANVEYLDISTSEWTDNLPTSLPHISLPRLRTLSSGYAGSQLFPYITVPALRKLGLSTDQDDSPTILRELAECIRRSRCSIRELELFGDADQAALHGFLVGVPLEAVRALTINDLDVGADGDGFSDFLDLMTGQRRIFPALENFKLRWGSRRGIDPVLTILAAASRRAAETVADLKSFQLLANAALQACEVAKNSDQLYIESNLTILRQSLSRLRESHPGGGENSEL